jgi:hypothetical protein
MEAKTGLSSNRRCTFCCGVGHSKSSCQQLKELGTRISVKDWTKILPDLLHLDEICSDDDIELDVASCLQIVGRYRRGGSVRCILFGSGGVELGTLTVSCKVIQRMLAENRKIICVKV